MAIYFPYLDFLLNQLKSTFSGKFEDVITLEGLIPGYHLSTTKERILTAAQVYAEDLNGCSENELRAEVELWHRYCKDDELKDIFTASEALHAIVSKGYKNFFPNVTVLLQLLATIPVTSATAERSFSLLNRLKTVLRSTMTEERLTGLALANVHKDENISVDEVVNEFCKEKPRRIESLDWC